MAPAERIEAAMAFVAEIDQLKGIFRQTMLTDGSRFENDAEHSWHIAVMACLLVEHSAEPIDLLRTVKMLLIHDLVEIDCGDVFCYDTAGMEGKRERETAAAERLFGMLPSDSGAELRAIWEEFEDQLTPESRYANALDRLQPMMHNYRTSGGGWRRHGITADRVLRRNRPIGHGSPALWAYAKQMIGDAVAQGYIEPGPDFDAEWAA